MLRSPRHAAVLIPAGTFLSLAAQGDIVFSSFEFTMSQEACYSYLPSDERSDYYVESGPLGWGGTGAGSPFTNTIEGGERNQHSYTSATSRLAPFTIECMTNPGVGNGSASASAEATWVFTSGLPELRLDFSGEFYSYYWPEMNQLNFEIYDLSIGSVIGSYAIWEDEEYDGRFDTFSFSDSRSYTIDPSHVYAFTLSGDSNGFEYGSRMSANVSLSSSGIWSVPEGGTLGYLALGLAGLLVLLLIKRSYGAAGRVRMY